MQHASIINAIQHPILSLFDQLVLKGAYQLINEALEAEIKKRLAREKMLVPEIYLHRLSVGDFCQCFQAFLGPQAPLS